MLQKIEIRNFQSHKATNMALSDRVNTIQGNSDCGKSAVMRALNWLIFNPAGDYFVSDWAKSPTGKAIKEACEVTVHVDDHVITRRRDKDFNGYMLDGQTFEATRNSVPQQVATILGLGEVNIQRQLDPPFLLSMSAGDVSRYINSLVNLTRIDTWTAAANGRSKSLMKDVDRYSAEVDRRQAEVMSYSWLPGLEQLSTRLTEIEARMMSMKSETDSMDSDCTRYASIVSCVADLHDVDKACDLLDEAGTIKDRRCRLDDDIVIGCMAVDNHDRLKSSLSSIPDLETVDSMERSLASLSEDVFELVRDVTSLESSVSTHDTLAMMIGSSSGVDKVLSVVDQLGRMASVSRNMTDMCTSTGKSLARYEELANEYTDCHAAAQAAEQQLSTMTCPMCGRKLTNP